MVSEVHAVPWAHFPLFKGLQVILKGGFHTVLCSTLYICTLIYFFLYPISFHVIFANPQSYLYLKNSLWLLFSPFDSPISHKMLN